MPENQKPNRVHSSPDRLARIWEAFRHGQQWAFRQIYLETYDSLYLYGFRLLSSEETTRDLIQDLFIKLWERRKSLPKVQNLKAYLFVTFRSMIIDYYRWNSKQDRDREYLSEHLVFSLTIEQQMIRDEADAELAHKLDSAIRSLSSREQEVVYLRYFQDLEYKEISRIMGIRYQSVRNLLHRAIEALRELL